MGGRGGARVGAGKKRIDKKLRVKRTFSLSTENVERIIEHSKNLEVSASQALNEIIAQWSEGEHMPPQAEQANIAPFDLDSIEESLNGIEKDLNKDSRASAPLDMNGDEYFYTSNREHLKQHLNNVAKQMYKNSGHAKRYKVAGNNPEVKQACKKSEALTEIKTVYGGSVVAVIALGIVKMDVQMWGVQPEKYKRSMLWSAFKFSGAT